MVQILANTSTIPAMQKRLSGLANTLEQAAEGESLSYVSTLKLMPYADEKKINLLAKIPTHNMASRHQEHSSARIDGTGNWIVNHKTYEEWKSIDGSLLWLSGGCKRSLR